MNTTRHGAGAGLWIADKLHKYLGSFLLSSVELYFKHEHSCQDKMHFPMLHILLQFDNNSSFTFFLVLFKIKCLFCAVQKCLVETRLWVVSLDHVLAI